MTTKRTLAAVLTALTACAAGAGPATAADTMARTDYKVVISGTGYYNRADITPTEWGDQTHQEDDEFTFRTEMPTMSFFDDVAVAPERSMGSATSVRGHGISIHPTGTILECDGPRVTDFVPGRMATERVDGHTIFKVRAFEAVQTAMPCNYGLGDYQKRFDAVGEEVGGWIFDAQFDLPGGSVGQEEIRIDVGGKRTGPACPGFHEETTICEISWEGEVVFTRLGWEELPVSEDDLNVPLEPKPANPTPSAPPVSEAPANPVTGKASLSPNALTVPVTCAAGCSGTATVSLAGNGARAAAAKKLATKRFTVAPGATKRITIRIPASKRRAVRRAGAVKVALAVTPNGGTPTTKRLTVKLRRR